MSGGGELFPFAPLPLINKGYGETTMDEHFVQGVVGGVLNRHKNRTLDKKKIDVLSVEIAAVLDRATQYTNVKEVQKSVDNPLSIEMWKGYEPEDSVHERYREYPGGDGTAAGGLRKMLEDSNRTDEYLAYWTCELCGKNTHEVDYDYLGNGTNHLECELKQENARNEHLDKDKSKQMEIEFPKEKS